MARTIRYSLLICGLAFAATAQQGTLAGPVAGFAFDSGARGLRPIQGIPGAAVLGDTVNFGVDVATVAVSPRLDSALVVAVDGSVHAFQLSSGGAGVVALNGVSASPERIAFSPSGTAAALYAAGNVQVITGLPAAPVVASSFAFTPGGGTARAHRPFAGSMAVSDDGALVLIADGAAVRLFQSGAERTVTSGTNSAVAFAPGSHDVAIANANNGVLLIRGIDAAGSQQTIGTVKTPVGAAFSQNGKTLFVASSADKTVTAFDLAGGASTPLACNCTPTGLAPMGRAFRLNEIGQGPLWMVDTAAAQPRIVFVPARVE